MDIYFHTNALPKKRIMLLSSLKKKKTMVVPEDNSKKLISIKSLKSTTSVIDFLQVSTIQVKKLWNQIIPDQIKQRLSGSGDNSKASSTILFDSSEHLKTVLSAPPTPPPKKSATLPNLVIITNQEDQFMRRALPSLPSMADSISIEERKNGITRATTWVSNSIQKWLSHLDNAEEQKRTAVLEHSELDEAEEQNIMTDNTLTRNALSKKMILHCRVLQVTNLASSKNYQYIMHMRVTNNTVQTHTGVMKRVAKGISAAHPRAAISFNVQGRFQVECGLNIKPCSSSKLVDRLKSFTTHTAVSTISEESVEDDGIWGHLVLDSGEEPLSSFANKGIGRYTIQTSTELALGLTIAFWLEKSHDEIDQYEDEEDDELSTPIDQDVLRYCQAGDYLTFYIKGENYPMWVRYWVTYKNNQLILRLNERGGEPVDSFSLKQLTGININPSDDILEEIYLGKRYGMILSFGKFSLYIFGDNCKSVRFWKCLLEQKKSKQEIGPIQIAKKYLWVAQ